MVGSVYQHHGYHSRIMVRAIRTCTQASAAAVECVLEEMDKTSNELIESYSTSYSEGCCSSLDCVLEHLPPSRAIHI